jgi:flagellar biosynthetic protein FliS
MEADGSISRAARAYARTALQSASKPQMLDELYNRLLRDCADARAAIAERRIEDKARAISHGLDIVTQLAAALDHEREPKLCAQLAQLYQVISGRLLEGGMRMEPSPIEIAERHITTLRTAFQKAAADVARQGK